MFSIFAQYYDQNMMDGQYGGWGFGMMLIWMLFLIAVVVGVVYLIRSHGTHSHHRTDPLDISKERYAKGDITREQFEQLKKDLK